MRRQRKPAGPVLTEQRTSCDVVFCGKLINMSAIARAQGLSQSYVSRLLNGERESKLSTYIKIAAAIDVTLDELVNGIEDRKQMKLENAKLVLQSYQTRIAKEDQSGLPPIPALRLPQDRRRKA